MNNVYTPEESVKMMSNALKVVNKAFEHETILDKFDSAEAIADFHDKVNVYKNTVMFWYNQKNPQRASKEVDCMVNFIDNRVK